MNTEAEAPTIESLLTDGNAMYAECRFAEAKKHYEEALAITGNDSISLNRYLGCLFNLSSACVETGDYMRAEQVTKLALSTVRKQMGIAHHMVGDQLNNLAMVLLKQNRFKEAEEELLEAINIIEKFFESDHPELVKPLNNLAHVYHEQRVTPKAVQVLERVVAIRLTHFGKDDAGIKVFKQTIREMQSAASTRNKAMAKPKDETVQLSLFG